MMAIGVSGATCSRESGSGGGTGDSRDEPVTHREAR